MSDEKPVILGPDGSRANRPHSFESVDDAAVMKMLHERGQLPPWLPGIRPGTRTVVAGWWWKLEQAVTNGDGQWALILTPIEPTAATKKVARLPKVRKR